MRRPTDTDCDTMEYKSVFKRYELKYLMDEDQKDAVLRAIGEHMIPDCYAHSTISNIYFDTPDFLLARRSISKPLYKEKLRVRSYGTPSKDDEVFVELKKKYDSVVYKRRLTMSLREAEEWLCYGSDGPDSQIGREIGFMKIRYPQIGPAMFLSYDRDAYCSGDSGDLRITIDSDITARTGDVSLSSDAIGHKVLPYGYTLMEIKTMYGYPEWLRSVLNDNRLYKSCFSKYGNAYKEMVLCRVPEEFIRITGGERTVEQEIALTEG